VQRAGGVAALTQVALYLVTGLLLLLGLGIGGGAPVPLQALEGLKLLQAGAGLVLVFALAERLGPGGGRGAGQQTGGGRGGAGGQQAPEGRPGGEGLAGMVALAVASGSIGAALLLASGGVGYATLTLYELFPQAEEAPGATAGPVSAVSSALNAVVSGLGNAAVFASGCWAFLSGWAGRRTGRLSPSLSVLMLVWGVAGVLAFVVPALINLALVLSLIALVWLGTVLLRPPAGPAPSGPWGWPRRGSAPSPADRGAGPGASPGTPPPG
jgi:hypothetical protein